MSEFFLVTTPGLEKIAFKELELKWQQLSKILPLYFSEEMPKTKIEKGGITLFLEKASTGWILNHYLKIPTRILQRLDEFRIRDIPKLFEKIRKMEWHQYLRQGPIEIEVSTHSSRLKIKERISQAVLDAIKDSEEHQPLRKKFLEVPQTIFVRIVEDLVVVSLDTSGEALYKRGYKKLSVEAPIRENLAAAFWLATELTLNSSYSVSGKKTEIEVIDPMCGSGTLLLEAALFWNSIRSRSFSYQNFPRASTELPSQKWPDLASTFQIKYLTGYDIDNKSVEATKNNLSSAQKINKEFEYSVAHQDSLELSQKAELSLGLNAKPQMSLKKILLVNPPYNIRLSQANSSQSTESNYFTKITSEFSKLNPTCFGILTPTAQSRFQVPHPYGILKSEYSPLNTTTGGLEITFQIFKN